MTLQRYQKNSNEVVYALQIRLENARLSFDKWEHHQQAGEGDWLVQNQQEIYTVERDSFAQTYQSVGSCAYKKKAGVWAELAQQDGTLATKEGHTAYRKGDYLVFNNKDRTDGYAVVKHIFEKQYSLHAKGGVMDAGDYLRSRVQDQIDWYERKSGSNQARFKRLQLVVVIAGALIPLLTVIDAPRFDFYIRFFIAMLGATTAMATASISLYRFQDKWVKYRAAAESLTREKYRYLTGATPYSGGEAGDKSNFNLLVDRCEAIMAGEFETWAASRTKDAEAKPKEELKPR